MTTDVDTQLLRLRLLRSAEELTPLPAAVTHLAQVLHDPDTGPDEVADAIHKDPVLTATVLREANSSWVAANSAIETVERAFILLGRARLLMLSIKGHVNERLQPALPQYGMAKGELWQHSVVSATAASVVRDTANADPGGAALTAALLHDLSKLVLCDYIDFRQLDPAWQQYPVTQIERHLLDIDHAELGGIITRRWGLPDSISDAIECHHDPEASHDPLAAHTVAIADAIAHDVLDNLDGDPEVSGQRINAVADSLDALELSGTSWHTMARRTLEIVAAGD